MNTHVDDEQREFAEEYYFAEVFNTISDEIISDEFFDNNNALLSDVSDQLCELNEKLGCLPPDKGRRIIEELFAAIRRHGIRP